VLQYGLVVGPIIADLSCVTVWSSGWAHYC